MSFNPNNFIRWAPIVPSDANTLTMQPLQITPPPTLPQMWGYQAGADNAATVAGSGYFQYFANYEQGPLYNNGSFIQVGDLIYCVCSDGNLWLQVSQIQPVIDTVAPPADIAPGTITTAMLGDHIVTYVKMQNVSATDKVLGRSTAGAGTVEEIACTAAGRAIIADVSAAAQRTTLGLGTIATQNANAVAITGGTLAGVSATTFTHTTGSLGTAVTAVTQAPLTSNTTVSTTAYTDAAVAAAAGGPPLIVPVKTAGDITAMCLPGFFGSNISNSQTQTFDFTGAVWLVPFYNPFSLPSTEFIEVYVQASEALSEVTVGIYQANADLLPQGAPLGSVAIPTIATGNQLGAFNVALTANQLYYAAITASSNVTLSLFVASMNIYPGLPALTFTGATLENSLYNYPFVYSSGNLPTIVLGSLNETGKAFGPVMSLFS